MAANLETQGRQTPEGTPTRITLDQGQYSHETRREVVAAMLIHGKPGIASELTGVPRTTIVDWLNSVWWEDVAVTVRQAVTNEVRAKLSAGISNGLDQVIDRMENGDHHLTRDGIVRVPVKLKDLAITTAVMIDKLAASVNGPAIAAVNSKVDTLADQLAALSGQVNAKTVSEQ